MKKVFVSGGSGYIALHCIVQLIKKNFIVITSVRNITRSKEIINSVSKIIKCKNRIKFVELDLMKDEGWDAAINGCEYVLHIASPVSLKVSDEPDTLIKPAVEGLKRCLRSAVNNKVKRFVMTSSFSAIGAGSRQKELNDDNWTDLNNPNITPYDISKTKAEIFLWNYVEKLNPSQHIEVCTINPVIVIGPSLSDDIGISNIVIRKLLDGSMPLIPKVGVNLIDVKDVAEMHIEAMLHKNAAGKRFLLSSESVWISDLAKILRNNNYSKVSRFIAPNFLIKLLSIFDKEIKIILFYLGFKNILHINNAVNILKYKPRKIKNAVLETAKQLYDLKMLK